MTEVESVGRVSLEEAVVEGIPFRSLEEMPIKTQQNSRQLQMVAETTLAEPNSQFLVLNRMLQSRCSQDIGARDVTN